MIKVEFFKGPQKKIILQLEQVLARFPEEYDMNNLKISLSAPGSAVSFIIVLYKAF